jgi:hypothetical protein
VNEEETMRIRTVVNNVLFGSLFLVLVISLVAVLNFRSQSTSQSPFVLQAQPTLSIITPPPKPTFNPTEIAEENIPVPTPALVVIPPEIKAKAGVTTLHPLAAQGQASFLEWSPDSSLALVRKKAQDYTFVQFANGAGIHGDVGDLWVVDVNGNARMKVSDTAYAWLWSPDSGSILFTEPVDPKHGLEGNLFLADFKSGQTRFLAKVDLAPELDMQWLPTGHIFLSQGSSLYRINPDGTDFSVATPLQLAPLYVEGATGGSAFRICPDESKIAYNFPTEKGNELWIADLNGSNAVRIVDWVVTFEWKLDCSQLVFSAIHKYAGTGYDSSIMTVRRDGTDLEEIVPASRLDEVNSFPQWASSGDWIVYVRQVPNYSAGWQEFQIWKIAPMSRETTLLVEHAGQIPYLSTDGRWLAFNTYVARRPDMLNAFIAEIDLGK